MTGKGKQNLTFCFLCPYGKTNSSILNYFKSPSYFQNKFAVKNPEPWVKQKNKPPVPKSATKRPKTAGKRLTTKNAGGYGGVGLTEVTRKKMEDKANEDPDLNKPSQFVKYENG